MRLKTFTVVAMCLLATASVSVSGAAVHTRHLTADFDADGYEDLAIGVPGFDGGAGAVMVLYGGPGGLAFDRHQTWRQSSDIHEQPEPGDRFGAALTTGDFDGDNYDDLAIGAPGEDSGPAGIGGSPDIGVVHVLYGSASGLATARNQLLSSGNGATLPPAGLSGLHFGKVLAAGDFDQDDDATDDLVIGVPDSGSAKGLVIVMYGNPAGLSNTGRETLHQGLIRGHPESIPENGDRFGTALAVGDFNDDHHDDLAVGAWGEGIGSSAAAGAVTVLYGRERIVDGDDVGHGPLGPPYTPVDSPQFWHQNIPGIPDGAQTNDLFGARLAAGDFDGDLVDDLAIGVPGESQRPRLGPRRWTSSGAVHVLYGVRRFTSTFGGLSTAGNQLWTQNSPGIRDHAESGDQFGDALAAGDFNGDQKDDLAIGASLESVGPVSAAGVVHVLYGRSVSGLTRQGNQLWHQNRPNIADSAEASDNFGDTLFAGDFDNSGRDDLAIGVPLEDLHGHGDAGAVHVLYNFGPGGGRFQLARVANQFWDLEQLVGPSNSTGHQFGAALPLSRFGF